VAIKGAVLNYEQQFYLSGILLSGVTSIDGSYSVSEQPINILGKGHTYPVMQGALVGDFQVNKYYIGRDPMLDYIGDSPISGSINFNNKSFGFNSGYLTEYSLSASIGSIPKSRSSIQVFGDLGSGISASGSNAHPDIEIPNQGSISMNTTGFRNNRVTDFNYNLSIGRSPVYKIGSPFPVQVDRQFPLIETASFSMDVNDHQVAKLHEYLIKPKQQDIVISIKNPINSNIIENITMEKARLLSHSLSSDSDNVMTLKVNYTAYINKK
jgi:hypothetical protein